MSSGRIVPQFLGEEGGRIFALLRRPVGAARGCVLVVAPFAEEMNKSRKMITEVGNDLAQRGIGSLIVDLYGTGDSDGEFEQASWDRWIADLRMAAVWCEAEGLCVDRLLGIRLGCALGAEVARSFPAIKQTVFWQPLLDGARFVDQFLRLRVAASMMEPGKKETTAMLRGRLAAGESVEVAGYSLSAALVAQLDLVRLEDHLGGHLGQIHWMEIVRSIDSQLPTPAAKAVENARSTGLTVSVHTVPCEPFWSSVEIVVNAELIERSVALLDDWAYTNDRRDCEPRQDCTNISPSDISGLNS